MKIKNEAQQNLYAMPYGTLRIAKPLYAIMTSTKSQTQILLKKIEYINYALTQDKSDLPVTEFYTIYHEIIDQVKTKSKELDSTYLSKKSSLFPSITLDELNCVKSFEDKQDHSVFFQLLLGPLVALFIALIPTKRKKIMKVFKEKESIILDLNNSIRNVLENPGIDKLLK